MLRFAVAGTGSFAARVIIPGLNASGIASVMALFGRTPERVADTAREHGIPNRFESYEEMLELEGLDAVAVCTPDFLHAQMAEAALASGRVVLSEKPLGMNSVETRRLARPRGGAWDRHGGQLHVQVDARVRSGQGDDRFRGDRRADIGELRLQPV